MISAMRQLSFTSTGRNIACFRQGDKHPAGLGRTQLRHNLKQ